MPASWTECDDDNRETDGDSDDAAFGVPVLAANLRLNFGPSTPIGRLKNEQFPQKGKALPEWLGGMLVGIAQRAAERHHAGIRRDLLRVDEQLSDMLAFTGRGE